MFSNRMRYIVLLRLLLLQLHTKERNGKARIKEENYNLKIQDLVNNLASDKIALTLILAHDLAHDLTLDLTHDRLLTA